MFALILFGMFIPYQAVLIPMFQTMSYTGLRGGLPGLILVHVIYGLPITTLIFRSYFAGISDELIEAAKVDGAGMLRTFVFVALPIAPPAFAVSMIWQFTSAWNDFLFGVLLDQQGPLADHRGAQQHRRQPGGPVQRGDGQRAAGVPADAGGLRPARTVLHARPDGRRAQGMTP